VKAKDAEAAVASGWAAYRPGFKRPLRMALPQEARNGWEERKAFQYETSPNERAVVSAYAWRAGDAWTVVLIDGPSRPSRSEAGRSASPAEPSPKGYTRESFAGRKAHPLDERRLAILKAFVADGMKMLTRPGWDWPSWTAGRPSGRGGSG